MYPNKPSILAKPMTTFTVEKFFKPVLQSKYPTEQGNNTLTKNVSTEPMPTKFLDIK